MQVIGYKLLTDTAIAPAIAFGGTDTTMGIDIYTDRSVELRAGSRLSIAHECINTPAVIGQDCDCHPHSSILPYANIKTGIALDLAPGTHVSWGGRSGLAFKNGMIPFEGKIDSNYRGELAVKIWSMDPTHDGYFIPAGTKIAQLYIIQYSDKYTLSEISRLSDSVRGEHGFGSTGT